MRRRLIHAWLDRLVAHFTITARSTPQHIGSGRNYIHSSRPARPNVPRWTTWLHGYLRKHYG